MNTWKEECVFVLENLGGHAYLKDIYENSNIYDELKEYINMNTKKTIK